MWGFPCEVVTASFAERWCLCGYQISWCSRDRDESWCCGGVWRNRFSIELFFGMWGLASVGLGEQEELRCVRGCGISQNLCEGTVAALGFGGFYLLLGGLGTTLSGTAACVARNLSVCPIFSWASVFLYFLRVHKGRKDSDKLQNPARHLWAITSKFVCASKGGTSARPGFMDL